MTVNRIPELSLYLSKCLFQFSKSIYEPSRKNIPDRSLVGKSIAQLMAVSIYLSQSIEFSLKSALSIYGLSVPKSHDLWNLYKGLPVDVKKTLSNHYAVSVNQIQVQFFELIPPQNLTEPETFKETKFDLKSAIKDSRNIFNFSRTVYELQDDGDQALGIVHISELYVIANILLTFANRKYSDSFPTKFSIEAKFKKATPGDFQASCPNKFTQPFS